MCHSSNKAPRPSLHCCTLHNCRQPHLCRQYDVGFYTFIINQRIFYKHWKHERVQNVSSEFYFIFLKSWYRLFLMFFTFKVLLRCSTSNPSHSQSPLWLIWNFFFSSTPDFTERAWLQPTSHWDAKKWHQNPKSPTPNRPPRPNLPVTLHWIGHPLRVRPGRLRSDERTIQRPEQRGGERRETNGSDGEEEETEGGKEEDFKNNNNNSKKTNNREKTSERKERGAEEAQRHPRSSN